MAKDIGVILIPLQMHLHRQNPVWPPRSNTLKRPFLIGAHLLYVRYASGCFFLSFYYILGAFGSEFICERAAYSVYCQFDQFTFIPFLYFGRSLELIGSYLDRTKFPVNSLQNVFAPRLKKPKFPILISLSQPRCFTVCRMLLYIFVKCLNSV